MRFFLYALIILILGGGLSAEGRAEPVRPRIHLVTHADLEDRAYLYELKCMLEKVFTLEVVLHEGHQLDLSGAYRRFRRQYNAHDLLNLLAEQKLPSDGYVFYMIEPDIYDEGYNFLFALMDFKNSTNVISLKRLRHADEGLTTDRVFRLIAKNIAKFNGHKPSGKCFMGYSNSLGALDRREVRLCEPDLSALKAMGLVKEGLEDNTIMKGCMIIS